MVVGAARELSDPAEQVFAVSKFLETGQALQWFVSAFPSSRGSGAPVAPALAVIANGISRVCSMANDA